MQRCLALMAVCRWSAPRTLRVAQYNPLAASTYDRMEDILGEIKTVDMFGLVGTQRSMARGVDELDRQWISGRLCLHERWRDAIFSNRSVGVTLVLGKSMREQHVVKVVRSRPELRGIFLAVRLRSTGFDLMPILMYFPPRA